MIFLGIDHAPSNYAFCVIDENNNIVHQENLKFKGQDFDACKLASIFREVQKIIPSETAFACLEGYAINERFYRETMGEIGAINRISLVERKIPFAIISPIQLKYYHTGSGKSTKQELREAVKTLLPDVGKDLNISDAAALALYAKDLYLLTTQGVLPTDPAKKKLIRELAMPKDTEKPKKKRMLYLFDKCREDFAWALRSE